jgi:hypothetical protein
MRGGVFCHLGRSTASVSYSGLRTGDAVENPHAEVSGKLLRAACEGRVDDDAVHIRVRKGLFDAIAT